MQITGESNRAVPCHFHARAYARVQSASAYESRSARWLRSAAACSDTGKSRPCSITTQRWRHHHKTEAPPSHSGSTTATQRRRHHPAAAPPHSGSTTTAQATAPPHSGGTTATQRQHHPHTETGMGGQKQAFKCHPSQRQEQFRVVPAVAAEAAAGL